MATNCTIVNVGKSRNGKPRYWCHSHGADATGRGGIRLDTCSGADKEINENDCFDIDTADYPGGIGIWGAVTPIYDTSKVKAPTGIHVHARDNVYDEKKAIDATFPAVKISYGQDLLGDKKSIISQDEAVNYYVSRFLNRNITHLFCIHCGAVHLDADEFAVRPHRKHLCNSCGKHFFDNCESISNPISLMREQQQDVDENRGVNRADTPLEISQHDYPAGMQIWASNPAILWTVPRPEHEGLHVHVYSDVSGKNDDRIYDETYSEVIIDGVKLDEKMARYLMAQQSLPYLNNKITSLICTSCGANHFDSDEYGFEPHIVHTCEICEIEFTAPGINRKVVSNPLKTVLESLANG